MESRLRFGGTMGGEAGTLENLTRFARQQAASILQPSSFLAGLRRIEDPRVVKELQVTTYHILWELVHVFFEQPGVLDPGVVS